MHVVVAANVSNAEGSTMHATRKFRYRLPTGEVREAVRRRDQADPRYAILGTRDGVWWGLFRMTQNNDELVRCINQLLDLGQAACVVRPRSTSR